MQKLTKNSFITIIFIILSFATQVFGALEICVTTSIIEDMLTHIVADRGNVVALMGPGVDPHLYKARPEDLRKLMRADIVFYNGLHLEGKMVDVFDGMKKKGRAVFSVTEKLDHQKLIAAGENSIEHDPHVWFDPLLWSGCIDCVVEKLIEKDPEGKEIYQAKAKQYKDMLTALAQWAQTAINTIPESQRVLITSHDAYQYFGKAFKIQVIGVQGISTASEAGLADIVSLVDLIKKRNIHAIFVETSVSPVMIERVSKDSHAKIGGQLFSDALGAKGEKRIVDKEELDVGTYEGVLKYNVQTIIKGLR